MNVPLVTLETEYRRLLAHVRPHLDLAARLPDSPFLTPIAMSCAICEYELFCSTIFGSVLESFAKAHGDRSVIGLVVDPDADDYYLRHFGIYPAFEAGTPSIRSHYEDALEFMPSGDITGALMYSANVMALVGSSGRWSMWGERILGIAIVKSDSLDSSWQTDEVPLFSATEALDRIVSLNFVREGMADSFKEKFVRNFELS